LVYESVYETTEITEEKTEESQCLYGIRSYLRFHS